MKHEVTTILTTPFTPDQIKKRKGLWGKMLDYIEGHSVILRLNEAFESDWSFSIVEHKILDNEVIVLGRLICGEIVKEQFGSNKITKDSETGRVLCLGDDLKSAATDSLKKCASLLGVGLHLYGNTSQATSTADSNKNNKKNTSGNSNNNNGAESYNDNNGNNGNGNGNGRNNGNGNGNSNGNGNGNGNLITPKQKKYVLTLGRRHHLDNSGVDNLCIENFDVPLSELTKSDASDLISMLTAA